MKTVTEKTSRTFHCNVITPEGSRRSCEARMVMFPGEDGAVGIMADRAPLVAALGSGLLTVVEPDGERNEFYIALGFAHCCENVLTILADECLSVKDIDPEQAWEQIQDARKMPADTDEALEVRDQLLSAARTKFRLAQKHRAAMKKRSGGGGFSLVE